MAETTPLDARHLPDGIRARFVEDVNGLRMHILEAGFEAPDRPAILLLHGFPELAYSWRRIMAPLAEAGYHVIAPDQRGYGRTTGWSADYDGDLTPFGFINLVRDALALVTSLGHRSVAGVFGHDFGSPVAAYCALIRPDVFRSVALMSAPFEGPPSFSVGSEEDGAEAYDIDAALAGLPRPRKHYHRYYSTRAANQDMHACPQGIAAFLRGYFHGKSADWAGNDPTPLAAWRAEHLARMPTYYIMDADVGMAETAATYYPTSEEIARCTWLREEALAVYAEEFGRTGFQGGLQWYRCRFVEALTQDLRLFAGRTIDVPSIFIAGAKDWGVYQRPGALETMQQHACTEMSGMHLVPDAGHWVQQERPTDVVDHLLRFLAGHQEN